MYNRPFRWWVQSVMPVVFDDSLSYYEVLAKLTKYIEGLTGDVDQIEKILGTIEGIEDVTQFTKMLESIKNEIGNLSDLSTQSKTDLVSAINEVALKADIAYYKPPTGIPESDLSQGVQDKLNKTGEATKYIINNKELKAAPSNNSAADLGLGTYTVPSGGIPWDTLSQDVRDRIESGSGGEGGTKDYTDLNNKPQINGHTLNAGDNTAESLGLGTYSKPGAGIPESDLSAEVQNKLNTSGGIADNQESFVASRDYEAGELVYINGVLYKTKYKILTGTTMIPGNNIETTDISNEIEKINNNIDALQSGSGPDSWSLKTTINKDAGISTPVRFFEYFNAIGNENYLFIVTPVDGATQSPYVIRILKRDGTTVKTETVSAVSAYIAQHRFTFTPSDTGEYYCTIESFGGTASFNQIIELEYTQSQGISELWNKVNEASQLEPRVGALETLVEEQQEQLNNIEDDADNLKSTITELVDYNDFEIIKPISKNNRTISGVSWAWDGDSCTVTGETPTTTNSVYDIYNASYPVAGQQGTTFPMGVNPGGSYYLKISSTATPTKVHFRAMYSTGGSYINAIISNKDAEFSIPSDAVRCVIRLYVDSSSGTISETVTVKLFPKILALETKDKTFVGAINENNNALNAICGIEYSSGASPVARKDYTSGSLILIYFNSTNQWTLYETATAVSKGTALSTSTNIRAVAQNCDNVAGWLKDYVDGRTYITSIVQTETSSQDEGNNVLTITLSNGAQATLTVRNGSKGSTGAQGAQGVQGLQGNSGYTGAAGELEVVNNLTDGGATSALSAEMGKTLNQKTSLLTGSTIINILDNGARRDEDISQTLYTIMHGLDDNPTGAVIYIPRGTYYMSFPIYWKSRVSLIGDGMGQTIIKPTLGTTPFRGDNLSDFVFDGFTIDGELTTTGKGIFHRFISNVIYRNLEIKNTCESGLGCDHFSNCVIENVWCDNCGRTGDLSAGTAYGCSGLGIGTGLFNQGVEALTVSNCHANNCRQYGIFFERQNETGHTSDRPVGTSVIGCTASGNRFGFGACGCDNLVFVGCTAYKNKAAGFSVDHGTLSGNEHTGTRVKFIGCVAKANGDGTTSGYPEYDNIPIGNGFVAIQSTKGMEMIGCCALENTNDGVYISAGSTDISIIGGGFDHNGANGIHFASGGYTQRIRIAPSFVRNNTAVGILNESSLHYGTIKDAVVAYNDIGIKSTTTVSDVYVKDNFVYSNTTSNFDGVVQG